MARPCAGRVMLSLVVWLLSALVTASPALANGAELLFSDSPEYLWAEADLIQQGRVMPTNVHPISRREWHETVLREPSPPNAFSSNRLVFTLRPYYCGFDNPYPSSAAYPVMYYNDTIPPLYQVGDAFSLGDTLHVRLVMDQTPAMVHMTGEGSYAPWKMNTLQFSGEYPRESYVSLAFPHAGVSFGRFKSGIGDGRFGNTFLNGRAPYYDQVQATYYTRNFKFFYMIASSQSSLNSIERQLQDASGYRESLKTFAYHRVEYQPADWVKVGFGEMGIVGGKFPDFAQINPVGLWHNTYTPECSNVMAMLDVSAVPVRGLQVSGEVTMDDYRLPTESAESNPNAFAYQVGVRYVFSFGDDWKHTVGGEFTHVDPWMYNRIAPYLTMYQRQKRQGITLDIPIGFAYGGDLNHFGVYYSALSRGGIQVDLGYEHLDKGQVPLGLEEDGTPAYEHRLEFNDGPSGIVETHNALSLAVTYPLAEHWELSGSIYFSRIGNFQHVTGQRATLVMFQIGLGWVY